MRKEGSIAYCENKLLKGELDYHSSSRTTNVAHFLKLECMQQLIKEYREFANILSVTTSEENRRQAASKKREKKIKPGIRR